MHARAHTLASLMLLLPRNIYVNRGCGPKIVKKLAISKFKNYYLKKLNFKRVNLEKMSCSTHS